MYIIRVVAPINDWNIDTGFFTGCYQAVIPGEHRGTWIGFTDRDEEWSLIKQFKTYKAAENKIKFLEKKIEENGYMWDWKLSIEEITQEDLI